MQSLRLYLYGERISLRSIADLARAKGFGLNESRASEIINGKIRPYPEAVHAFVAALAELRPGIPESVWRSSPELTLPASRRCRRHRIAEESKAHG